MGMSQREVEEMDAAVARFFKWVGAIALTVFVMSWLINSTIQQDQESKISAKVEYQIAYGDLYTGTPTPIMHRGSVVVDGYTGGVNGLPISQIFPVASNFSFSINGQQATLSVPCASDTTIGYMVIDGQLNPVLMDVIVDKKIDSTFLICAHPSLKQFG